MEPIGANAQLLSNDAFAGRLLDPDLSPDDTGGHSPGQHECAVGDQQCDYSFA